MNSLSDESITIANKSDLSLLLKKIKEDKFAKKFNFRSEELKKQFFKDLHIDISNFEKRYYFYNKELDLHISESEFNYLWISTIGIVGHSNINNKFLKALCSQNIVVNLLFKEVMKLCDEESTLDVDSHSYGYLSELTPALFHNVLFYFELFGKTYLSLNDVEIPKTHKLERIYTTLKQTMLKLNHNDTIFHASIVQAFDELVKYIKTIPGEFKEQYVKYNDNIDDSTAVLFDKNKLDEIKTVLDMSYDFICNYYYNIKDAIYLKKGLYDRLYNKANNEVEKKRIKQTYSYLINNE